MILIKRYFIQGEDGCTCEITEEIWNLLSDDAQRKLAEQDQAGDIEGAEATDVVEQFEEDLEENKEEEV